MSVKALVIAVAYGLGLLLLLALGSWQISRGLEKAHIQALATSRGMINKPLTVLPTDLNSLNYQTATLQGSWDEKRIILLANRIYQSQLGYEVIVPFKLSNAETGKDKIILINRGWISQQQQNNIPPSTNALPSGTLYFPEKGFTLGESFAATERDSERWPKVSLYMDLPQFSRALGEAIEPVMLVLDAENPNSLTRIWKAIVIQPERHYAYALQWYGLSAVFIIFGIIWFRRYRQNQSQSTDTDS